MDIGDPAQVRGDQAVIGLGLEGDDVFPRDHIVVELLVAGEGSGQDCREDGSQEERDVAKTRHGGFGSEEQNAVDVVEMNDTVTQDK